MASNRHRNAFLVKLGLSAVDHLPKQLVMSFHHLSVFAWGFYLKLDLLSVKPLRDLLGC